MIRGSCWNGDSLSAGCREGRAAGVSPRGGRGAAGTGADGTAPAEGADTRHRRLLPGNGGVARRMRGLLEGEAEVTQ